MKIITGGLAIVAATAGISAGAKECTAREEYAALAVVEYLDSWKNVNLAYRHFQQCDDGAIAEGYSEAVARLLVDHWSRLPELGKLTANDSGFESFVLKRINATLDAKDLDKLHDLAKEKCPKGHRILCGKLTVRVESAWKDQ